MQRNRESIEGVHFKLTSGVSLSRGISCDHCQRCGRKQRMKRSGDKSLNSYSGEFRPSSHPLGQSRRTPSRSISDQRKQVTRRWKAEIRNRVNHRMLEPRSFERLQSREGERIERDSDSRKNGAGLERKIVRPITDEWGFQRFPAERVQDAPPSISPRRYQLSNAECPPHG
jgi:hypothetical protein